VKLQQINIGIKPMKKNGKKARIIFILKRLNNLLTKPDDLKV